MSHSVVCVHPTRETRVCYCVAVPCAQDNSVKTMSTDASHSPFTCSFILHSPLTLVVDKYQPHTAQYSGNNIHHGQERRKANQAEGA